MLTSWQIAAMHSQQSQMFGAQQAYSQQLSSMMPAPYQGLGATGFGGGFQQGGGYNYGQPSMGGYGPGNSFGNAATSMMGGAGSALGGGMRIGGFAAGLMGMGPLGVGLGAAGAAMSHVSGAFTQGAHEQASLERTLSQFQFSNASSRTGKGFTRGDSQAIGDMVRHMERIPEMLTSFGELNRVMDKMGQMGLMQGVKDAGEFINKFKTTISTLKDLSKLMGTTMEGALQAFGESRMSGFYAKGDIVKNVLNRQVTGALTGMNQGQVGAVQAFGADMGHAMGGSRRTGAMFANRTAGQLGVLNQMGVLSNDQIMEMTGKEGAEGIQDLSMGMTQLGYKMGNSNVGQAMTLALGKMKDGRYTGEMDDELVQKVRRGELSLDELKSLARSKAGSRGAKLSFAAHKDRLRSEMVGSVGTEGISMQLKEILGEKGWSNPDANNLVMQRFGATEEQANLLQQMMPNLESMGGEMAMEAKNQKHSAGMNAAMKDHGWDAIKAKIGKKISHYTTDWAKDLGNSVRNYFQTWADDFLDDLSGQYTEKVTKSFADRFKYGGKSGPTMSVLERSAVNVMGAGGGATDISVGKSGGVSGLAARGMHWLSGDMSQGERIKYAMEAAGMGSSIHGNSSMSSILSGMGMGGISQTAGKGDVILASGQWANEKDINKAMSYLNSGSFGSDSLSKLKSAVGEEGLKTLAERYKSGLRSGIGADEDDPIKRLQKQLNNLGGLAGGIGIGGTSLGSMSGITREQLEKKGSDEELVQKMRKAGLSGQQITSALQQLTGTKMRGHADASGLSGELDFRTGRGAAALRKKTEGEIKDILGDEAPEIIKLVGDSHGMASLLEQASAGNNDVRDILATPPEDWSDKERATLKRFGVDPDEVEKKFREDPSLAVRLEKAGTKLMTQGGGAFGYNLIARLGAANDIGSASAIAGRMSSYGKGLTKGMGATENKDLVSKMSAQDKASLQAIAQRYTGANAQNLEETAGEDETYKLLNRISGKGFDAKERERVLDVGGPELRQLYSKMYGKGGARSKLGNVKEGAGVGDVLGGLGFSKEDISGMDEGIKKDIEKAISGGKTKGLDKNEIESVVKILLEAEKKGLVSKAGTEAKSDAVSETEVANAIKGLSDNNAKAAAILNGIATGHSVSDSLKDLAGGKT